MRLRKYVMLFIASLLMFATVVPIAGTASAAGGRPPVTVSGNYTNVDFNVTTPTVTNGTYTVEAKLLGTVTPTSGQNAAGLVTDANGLRSFYLEADTIDISTFKSAIQKTDRFGIQTRVKFNNTNSKRSLFEMKSMNPPTGSPSWLNLLIFDSDGKIKDYKLNVLGTYAADQWYDIIYDVDTPNHRYSVWINGSIVIDNLDLNSATTSWVGVTQSKIIQYKNTAQTPSMVTVASFKAGTITDPVPLASLAIQPLSGEFYANQTKALTLVKNPSNTTETNINWSSSNTSVATVDSQGVVTGVAAGMTTITVTSADNPSVTATLDLTLSPALQPINFNANYLDLDFNTFLPPVSNNVTTFDSKFLGTVTTTSGATSAGIINTNNTNVFQFEAVTADLGSFKSGLNKTDHTGIRTRLQFNNTNSKRSIFEMKSVTPPTGTAAWDTLLFFDADGKIKDYQGNVLDNYAADQWYDIDIDLDSPKHRYSVWINGKLKVYNLDLGNWIGITQNRIIQYKNSSNTSNKTYVAYMKVGTIIDPVPLTSLSIQPLSGNFYANQTKALTLVKNPSNTSQTNFNWSSSNTSVATVDNQGVITGVAAGTTTITVASVDNPSVTATLDITLSAAIQPVNASRNYLDLDFNTFVPPVSSNVTTIDSLFLGTVATTSGATSAGIINDGDSNVFQLEAITGDLGTFKSGLNKTDHFSIRTRMKFNNTNSKRSIFEMKSVTPPTGTAAWDTLLFFDADGKIKDYQGNVLDNYAANQWYDIVVDLDSPKHRYSVWINGKLYVNNLDLGNWVGITQNRLIQYKNSSNTSNKTYVAYMKVGIISPLSSPVVTGQTVQGWAAWTYTGLPVFAEDASESVDSIASMTISGPTGTLGSYAKEFPVTPGKRYSFSSFMRGEGLSSSTSVIKAVLTSMKNGEKLQVDNLDVEEETPALVSDKNAFGGRILYHFTAPADADSVRVQLVFSGPGTAWFNDPRFEEKQNWQDVMGHYSSADVQHPITNPGNMYGFGGVPNESDATLLQQVAPIMAMSDTELQAAAKADAHTRTALDVRGSYEAMARRLAILYTKTGTATYAHKAIIILTEEAKWYPDVPLTGGENFFFKSACVPVDAVYAYDILYASPEWNNVQESLYVGTDVRAFVEGWFRTAVMNMFNYYSPGIGGYDNIAPYGVRAVFGTAAVLNDPDMIRLFMPWVDSLLSNREVYADGFWNEATVSYNDQVIQLFTGAFDMLQQNFKDPAGYVDNKYQLQFEPAFNLGSRYPLYTKGLTINQQMKLPDGSPVAINDTWNQDPALKSVEDPILPENIKNIELYNYGQFSLVQGDTNDATYAGLTFPQNGLGGPYTTGGHQHADYLNLNLFGSGMEVIPDTGYPHDAVANRYLQMTAPMHNVPWAWSSTANYIASSGMSTRASMLAYDPGDQNGKAIQLVEASELGPVTDNVDTKRRMIMMVNMDGNRSYTLDLSRLKGGEAHQIFMRAAEDEDTDMTTSLNLTAQPDADVNTYMTRMGHTEGLPDGRATMKSPQTADGNNDFNFTWKGKTSGTSLRAYMNGISGDELIFSRIPTLRWTYNKAALKDSFPGWHFQRRQLVNPNDTTEFGAVYETWRSNQQPLINNVTWKKTADQDPMTQVAVVDVGSYIDTIYLSNDTTVREVDGVQFAGRVAMIRKDKMSGAILKGYVYGAGSIQAPGFALQGKPDVNVKVTGTTSTYNGALANGTVANGAPANTLTIDGNLPNDNSLNGLWLQTKLGDQSGYGMRINSVQGSTINVHDYPPFTITPAGAKQGFFQYVDKVIPGDVIAEIHQPTFVSAIPSGQSIQSAIDSAQNGDTIVLSGGVYTEQLNITKSLTIIGNGATIQAPDTAIHGFTGFVNQYDAPIRPIVYVSPGVNVKLQDMTIDGRNKGDMNYPDGISGIGIDRASATIDHVTVKGVNDTLNPGMQYGYGIFANNTGTTAVTVVVTNSTITDYQKNGIFVLGNITGTVTSNTVTGHGPTSDIAQNGIVFLNVAGAGTISNNTVSQNYYNGSDEACGILLFSSPSVTLSGNQVSDNQAPTYVQ
ncbi:hypothetical protein A8709_13855 [Paenibacillus pectinilyticus]|uniref:BIG2 domain-containing protein n=1 Tax=Paenibacillus pectinilyticus TaxID=512399 RepID=A0A1C1A3Q1_9BACL|nr:Ig-like domain-containing protein [Paenibacillus pectinilyticus]OCT15183.1 hypothetical protein A8709_13855 [Paenibacillus pectinilyticus]